MAENETMDVKFTAEQLAKEWGAPFVARNQAALDRATGGVIKHKTLVNYDSLGLGPAGRVRMGGRNIAYPAIEFFRWLLARTEKVEKGGPA